MKDAFDINFVEFASRRVADLNGDDLSIDDACSFIRETDDANVLPWKDEKVAHILATGRAFGLATKSTVYASAFSASLNAATTGPTAMVYPDDCKDEPDDGEVGGILTAEYLRGARIVYQSDKPTGSSEMSLARGFVSLVVSSALYDAMGVPGFVVSDPLPVTYNTMDTAGVSRAIGYKLGFRAPSECPTAQDYALRVGYQRASNDRGQALGHNRFQLAYLQPKYAGKILDDALQILSSPKVLLRASGVTHRLSISERVFPRNTIDLLSELQLLLGEQK
ncbi:hypothetical protein [uncultured Tateyamaria sp.]|uniref:hypothetical protein n=1 Tax=uncultured Tateyamaria sp. TaxID=455651 RepID=UPI00260EEA32|nr:hypothetical protein [uncultured Tateyamaria sp.]